jgi:hypothetical protein
MGCFGKCACDCCLDASEMPYTSVTINSPLDDCGPGEPTPKTEDFVQDGCCWRATFEYDCQPLTNATCNLYAKQAADFSFDAIYYRQKISYNPPGEYESVDEFDCPCTPVQQRSVDVTATAKIFYLRDTQLVSIVVTVGKAKIQCDGDAFPVCKPYIAVTYEYNFREAISLPNYYRNADFACTGLFQDGDCSVTHSWNEESGTLSDDCPYDGITQEVGPNVFASTYIVSRIKFYDELPEIGDAVSIGNGDDDTFDCCSGKTNCTIAQSTCGLAVSGSCPGAVAPWPFSLNPCGDMNTEGSLASPMGALCGDDESGLGCCEVEVNGYQEPSVYDTEVYVLGAGSNPNCYAEIQLPIPGTETLITARCQDMGVGFDFLPNLCGTHVTDWGQLDPSDLRGFRGPYCDGGEDPPAGGLCLTGDCCELEDSGFVIELTCSYLEAEFCGLKIENYECTAVRTDYSVGTACVSVPTVIMEFA